MNIRPLDRPDLPQFFGLLQAKARFDGGLDLLRADLASIEGAFFGDAPPAHALVAERAGRLTGIAIYHASFSSFIARPGLWLDDLYVDAAFRGQGIGRKLMQSLCRIAVARGCARVEWHVSAVNPRGIAFYRGLGAAVSEKARGVCLAEADIHALAHQSH
jgi:GNAT superfamily N-acetyltransferase